MTLYLQNSKTFEYTGAVNARELSSWITQSTLGHLVPLDSSDVVKLIFENDAELPAFLLLKNSDFPEELLETLRAFCE